MGNGAAFTNRLSGCFPSRDESREHGDEPIQERAGPGKVFTICRRGGETLRHQGAHLLPDNNTLPLPDRDAPREPEPGDQMDQRVLLRVFQSETETIRPSVPGAV